MVYAVLSCVDAYRGDNLDATLLSGLVHHGEDHLLVGLGLGGVRAEGELRLEHRLTL